MTASFQLVSARQQLLEVELFKKKKAFVKHSGASQRNVTNDDVNITVLQSFRVFFRWNDNENLESLVVEHFESCNGAKFQP